MAVKRFLLDTSTCIALLRGNQKVRIKCMEHEKECCISTITVIELLYGAYHAPMQYRTQELTKARLLINHYDKLGIDSIPDLFCREKLRLEKAGMIVEDFDLMIGITGVVSGLTVVTHNRNHFDRIEGLNTEDWTL
ncbi:MAG: PIN domain-containing protein [Bacteroidales bacterium]|nr:PIN domain-containing protein [Bacteroidales bacterium]